MAVINGTSANELLFATNEDDTVNAGAGNDVIVERPSFSVPLGLGGDDVYNGGDGNDQVYYARVSTGVTVDLRLTSTQDTGGGGLDQLISIESIFGSDFADFITGNELDNTLSGNEGNDTVVGLEGNDTLFGGFGGDDLILGGTGIDYVAGLAGDDTCDGGLGDDSIYGGDGTDIVSFESAVDGVTIDLALSGPQMTVGSGVDIVEEFEGIIGSMFNDDLRGTNENDMLSGARGSDLLQSLEGFDLLEGGGGRDSLLASTGNDTLIGGLGADLLTGGDDIDLFIYRSLADSAKGSADIITDFERFVDRLDLGAIDADTTLAGDQAFTVVDRFSGAAGELILRARPAGGSLRADVDGDGAADLIIRFNGAFAIPLESDIVL